MKCYLAIDIGGTEIKYALINSNLEIMHHDRMPTAQAELNVQIPSQINELIARCLQINRDIAGVGISTAGVVDHHTGEILYSGPTMPTYCGTNIKTLIEAKYSLPTTIINDVNAAAIGEKWLGAGRNYSNFFCMTLGTGVGGAIVMQDELYVGHNYRAGEVGHMPIKGLLELSYESRASMKALLNIAKQRLNFTGDGIALFEQAKAGDTGFHSVIDEWLGELARGLIPIIYVLDPEAIVIGGAVSAQGDYLLHKLQSKLREHAKKSFVLPTIVVAELGNKAALYGAIRSFIVDKSIVRSMNDEHGRSI